MTKAIVITAFLLVACLLSGLSIGAGATPFDVLNQPRPQPSQPAAQPAPPLQPMLRPSPAIKPAPSAPSPAAEQCFPYVPCPHCKGLGWVKKETNKE